MTFKNILSYVDSVRPNPFDEETKLGWLGEADGLVRAEIHGEAPEGVSASVAATDIPAAPVPYLRLYPFYVFAMMDFLCSDYDRYKVSAGIFEDAMELYAKHYVRTRGK